MTQRFVSVPWSALVLGCLLTSCLGLDLGQSGSDGGASASAGAGGAGGSGADDAASGLGCATDSVSGVTLCRAINACPNVVVDADLFPHCGFRVHQAALDFECLCGDDLCPMGTTVTCAQVASLLASQSELLTCTQVSEGRCAQTTGTPSTMSPPSGGQAGSGCDRTCQSECAGDPGCYRLCGC